MMVKLDLVFYFEILLAPSELLLPSAKNCLKRLNWPFRSAGNSEGASRIPPPQKKKIKEIKK